MQKFFQKIILIFLFSVLFYCNPSKENLIGKLGILLGIHSESSVSVQTPTTPESGGILSNNDFTLNVPPGAYSSDLIISASEVSDIPNTAINSNIVGVAYDFGPDHIEFDIDHRPVLTIKYDVDLLAEKGLSEDNIMIFWYDADSNTYVAEGGIVDKINKTITVPIEHFTLYLPMALSQLPGNTPPSVGASSQLPTTARAGAPLYVRSVIIDPDPSGSIVRATLYYKVSSASTYTAIPMSIDEAEPQVPNRYGAVIPASAVTTAGVNFYVEAQDNLGAISTNTVITRTPTTSMCTVTASQTSFNIASGFNRLVTFRGKAGPTCATTVTGIIPESFVLNGGLGIASSAGTSGILFTAKTIGTGSLDAVAGAFNPSSSITVTPGLMKSIEILSDTSQPLPGTLGIAPGTLYTFDVIGKDAYGNATLITPNWTATGSIGTFTNVLSGILDTTGGSGTGTITASLGGISSSLNVQVGTITVPTGVAAAFGFNQNTISWNPVVGANSYNIYFTMDGSVPSTTNGTKISNVSATTYIHTGLATILYNYVVTAVNAGSESTESVMVGATPVLPPPPLVAPTGVTATAASPGNAAITISWNPVPGATSYNIYFKTASGVTLSDNRISGATSPYLHIGLNLGTTYYYIVTAVNGGGEGPMSAEVSAVTLTGLPASTPTISPVTGSYSTSSLITMTTTTPGATLYYTTDGSTPTSASNVYLAPFALTQNMTVKAIAIKSGYYDSIVAVREYKISKVSHVQFSPPPGNYASSQNVNLYSGTPGTTIYYTTDGSAPTTSSSQYTGAAISVSANTTVKAIAVKSGYIDSPIGAATYTIGGTAKYAVGGWVSGLYGEAVVLQNNGGDNVILTGNGPFTFPTPLASGTNITITVLTQPSPQTCRIDMDDSGTASKTIAMTAANFINVSVVCGPVSLPVADTGQTLCYNASTSIACGDVSFPGQDGDYNNTPLARSFTGPTPHGTYTSDYTTTDNVTGLVWKTCSEGLSGATCATGTATTATWIAAGTACYNLNNANSGAGYAGRKDWRLPIKKELGSLVNYGVNDPIIDTAFFPGTVSYSYWTSSTSVGNALNGSSVHFRASFIYPGNKAAGSLNVRCVSGGNGSAPAFSDNNDGTVTDQKTNLVWQKCSMGQNNDASCSGTATTSTWTNALTYCKGLSLAGKTWRIPNIRELESITDLTKQNPSIDILFFPATVANYYWSASTAVSGTTFAWYMNFISSIDGGSFKMDNNYVRCVTGP